MEIQQDQHSNIYFIGREKHKKYVINITKHMLDCEILLNDYKKNEKQNKKLKYNKDKTNKIRRIKTK